MQYLLGKNPFDSNEIKPKVVVTETTLLNLEKKAQEYKAKANNLVEFDGGVEVGSIIRIVDEPLILTDYFPCDGRTIQLIDYPILFNKIKLDTDTTETTLPNIPGYYIKAIN